MIKKTILQDNDEINLIELTREIWNSKVKILLFTIIFFLIGFGYNYQLPNNYSYSLVLSPSNNVNFIKLVSIERFLNIFVSSENNESSENNKKNEIILDNFIKELNDYEEFISSIKNTKKVEENISGLSLDEENKALFGYANLLEIINPNEKGRDKNIIIKFTWDNTDEAINIIRNTLNFTLINLKNSIFKELDDSLEIKRKNNIYKDQERLNFLTEQASIASVLDIYENEIGKIDLSKPNVSFNINTPNFEYYLRGTKAIDEEIRLIKQRDYSKLKIIKREIDSFKTDEIKWINYNLYLTETKTIKKTKVILVLSILLGFLVGVFFVIISSLFQFQTNLKKNTD